MTTEEKRQRGQPRATGTRQSRFADWIDSTGAQAVADHLNVKIGTVLSWRRYAVGAENGRRPDPGKLADILLFARGKLKAVDIYPPVK